MSSKKLTDLSSKMQVYAVKFITVCANENFEVMIYCTWRSNAEQDELYASGRTKAGKLLTNARAGQSKHNDMKDSKPASNAFDAVPMRAGKCLWNDSDAIKRMGVIGESVGLKWAGRWAGKLKESVHFEL